LRNAWLLLALAAELASSDPSIIEKALWNPQLASTGEKVPTARPIDAYRRFGSYNHERQKDRREFRGLINTDIVFGTHNDG
jgi:hypothetical protein